MSVLLAAAFKKIKKIEITPRDMMWIQRQNFLSVAMASTLSLRTVIESQKISVVLFSSGG